MMIMLRTFVALSLFGGLFCLLSFSALPVFASEKIHRVVIHVDEEDKKKHNLVLNNVENLYGFYQAKGEKVEVEIVAYGPGLTMLRDDKSSVKKRINIIDAKFDNLVFSGCGVTFKKVSKKEGKKVPLLPEARLVEAGLPRIIELQDAGWNYIRP